MSDQPAVPTLHLQHRLVVETRGRGLVDLTAQLEGLVARSGISVGLCVVYCRHTSAGLIVFENASPDATRDLLAWLQRLAPEGDPRYEHVLEGADDMPAHLRSVLTRTSETVPVGGGRLLLGTWQGVYLAEHRARGSKRELVVHLTGARA